MIVLCPDRIVDLGDWSDARIAVLAASMRERDYHALVAHQVFGRALRVYLEQRAKARVPSARDWALSGRGAS